MQHHPPLSPILLAAALLACGPAVAQTARLEVAPAQPAVVAGQKNKVYLKVGLTGLALESADARPPVNVAIVLDKSGSMSGEKLARAKQAARFAVDRLSPHDIVSIVAYDSTVQVVVPATKAVDKQSIHLGIERLAAGGNTALFAGVSKGADELRKFFDHNRVNRLVLLSDGLANVGPSSAAELARLGGALMREGMSVTTLGLGLDYNEDLMSQLARAADGNHAFIEHAQDLARFFDLEFGTVLKVVARDATLTIDCAPGVRPVRLLGREGDIVGQQVVVRLNQLYAGEEKFALLELEVGPGELGGRALVARAAASYGNLVSKQTDALTGAAHVEFVATAADAERRIDQSVMVRAVELIASEQSRLAVVLNDQGRTQEAERVLLDNAAWLDENWQRYKAPSLKQLQQQNIEDSKNLAPDDYRRQRKVMRKRQVEFEMQQLY
ncbi:MAG: VWA domain-containing protein [Myxococcales bacterium]|nr:VWA domain-containing protein [Myxococcales bacterium]MCB9541507.1 VWA domain-containing protein [Myxococcales bacterium]MCB9554129.1 VWA domain-containing protein [Myxococcales bacterium]